MPKKKKQLRKNNRRLDDQSRRWKFKHCAKLSIGLLVLAGLVGLGEYIWVSLTHQPFRHVEVSSDGDKVQVAKLEPLVRSYVTGDFFTLNTGKLRSHLLLLPWVETVSIRRVWPDKLEVAIHERKAIAVWNEVQLVGSDGSLCQSSIATYPANLPELKGPEHSEMTVLHEYGLLLKKIKPLGLRLVALSLEGHSWMFRLDSGARVYFSDGEQQQLSGFDKLYSAVLHHKMQRVERVDLRYAGGASVRWKSKIRKKHEH